MSSLPFSVYQYSSHLEFLQDAYGYFHSQDESFSYEKLATRANLRSRTEVRNLFKGDKKLDDAILKCFAQIFQLDTNQTKYLLCLKRFIEAGNSPAAYAIFERLVALQKEKLPGVNPFREVEIATSVIHMTLLSVFDLQAPPQTISEVSEFLKGRYSPEEIRIAIEELEKYHYIFSDPMTGRWRPKQKFIRKYDYNSNFFLRRFHQQSLKIASEALETEGPSERYLVGASFCINGKVFSRIVQKMNAFTENLMQLEGMAGEPDTVVHFNQQLMRLSLNLDKNELVSQGLVDHRLDECLVK